MRIMTFWGQIRMRLVITFPMVKKYPKWRKVMAKLLVFQKEQFFPMAKLLVLPYFGRRMAYIGPSWAQDSGRMTWGTSWNGG